MPRRLSTIGLLALLTLGGATACDEHDVSGPSTALRDLCDRTVTLVTIETPVNRNTTGHEGVFRVTNVSGSSNTAAVTCTGIGTVTCTTGSQSVTLAAGASKNVQITFNAGGPSLTSGVRVSSCGGSASPKVRVL